MKRLLPITCGALLWITACADSEPLPSGGPRSVGAAPTGRDETHPSNPIRGGPRSVVAAPKEPVVPQASMTATQKPSDSTTNRRPRNETEGTVEGATPGEPVVPEVPWMTAEEDPDNPLIRTETLEIEGEKPMTIFVFKNIETLEKKSSTEAPNHPADLGGVR